MKKVIFALVCILTISIGMTATSAPIDTSPDIECVITPSVDIDNTFTSVVDHPCFDLANVVCASTSIEGVRLCVVALPNCEDPLPLGSVTDKPIRETTLTAPNPDPTAGLSAECTANLLYTASESFNSHRTFKAKRNKAKRRNARSRNSSTFPGHERPRPICAAYS